MLRRYLLLLALCVASSKCELKSPCAELFEYTKQDEVGRWEGVVNVKSDCKLHGLWMRIFLEGDVSELNLLNIEGEVKSLKPKTNGFIIINPDLITMKNVLVPIKFAVVYEGNNPPNLSGIRLNTRTYCPVGAD
ncbi:PREDICTED: uncharacterized protein LOC108559661 [Nicrophorus vespilloides]|uniref:Uncharacterized protein LOC108559661 n=1 Tax=Nicrophorus vespilloides TaxID=110193 RepID=A0ABM1MD50_NICVS|nr:PREDICTED: uncharacterized protein LOC108559661 [Nicrophorus vespilloides]